MAMPIGIYLLGRMELSQDSKVEERGTETVATVYDEGKRMIKLKYHVNGQLLTSGVGKGYSNIEDGEEFYMKYLPEDPEKIVVFFDKPALTENYEYQRTSCNALSKTLSIIDFSYFVNGQHYRRKTIYREQQLNPNLFDIWYRTENPQIGYLIKKQD